MPERHWWRLRRTRNSVRRSDASHARQALAIALAAARTRTFRGGDFSVEAELVDVEGGDAIRMKIDGLEVISPLRKLNLDNRTGRWQADDSHRKDLPDGVGFDNLF